MVISMTGFGRSYKTSSAGTATVEIKSVNHRFCEFVVKTPRQLLKAEEKIKKTLSQYIKRGRVEVFISLNSEGLTKKSLQIDWSLLENYYQFILDVKNKYDIAASIDFKELLNLPDIVAVEEKEEGNEELEKLLLQAVEEAAVQLKNMRSIEGAELHKDLVLHLKKFQETVVELKLFVPNIVKQYRDRLEKRIREYADGLLDEARIMTEIAIYADKADINEELTRLESHISQFGQTIELQDPIGRKLDFLLQEMNREVNTISSKSSHSKISSMTVELKTTLEKIREQAQNIE
ncbi:YicC/YloC family endoribonuclease [Heyndrickxia acidicola]|uniref:YicC family protein n=1 Tax=Heyndrickxia acidicola TaxID=209389 RepID=A0ABU6MBS7_9BACI|nr:YicC/YloC family endoribonuclease [Heyndrickxia acidicola]MED1202133.1 YicC family protein [Heyndrickxia acidicola]